MPDGTRKPDSQRTRTLPVDIRMACLKLALGDATPRTMASASAHIEVAESYAQFLLGASASRPAGRVVDGEQDVGQQVDVLVSPVEGPDLLFGGNDLLEDSEGQCLPASGDLGHSSSSVGGVATSTVGSAGGVSNDSRPRRFARERGLMPAASHSDREAIRAEVEANADSLFAARERTRGEDGAKLLDALLAARTVNPSWRARAAAWVRSVLARGR